MYMLIFYALLIKYIYLCVIALIAGRPVMAVTWRQAA
jgi:hypothetical protein